MKFNGFDQTDKVSLILPERNEIFFRHFLLLELPLFWCIIFLNDIHK